MLIKDVRCEAPVCIKKLPLHHAAHTQISLCYVSDVVATRVHDNIFVGLLETQHYVHELQLSGNHNARVGQNARRRVRFIKHAV